MNEKTKYTGIELMGEAPVGMAIIRLALPMVAAMLAQSIYNMTDMFFIGQTKDPNMVAAVSLAYPLFMLSQALGNIFATGGSSYISRMLGAGERGEVRKTSAVSFYLSFGIGLLLTAALWIFKTPVLRLIGASDATFTYADDYLSVVILFMAFAAAGAVMSGQMRSEGETKKAMTLQLIGIVLNIVLDPILILWLKMGTAGAAWATVAGQFVSYVYGIFYFVSKKTVLSIKLSDFKPNKNMLLRVLSIGIPAGISNIIMSLSNILGNRMAAEYGDHIVAGNGVQMRVASLIFMLVFALVQGYQPFAGYNFGAKRFDRLRKGFKLTLIYSTGLCIVGSVLLTLFGDSFIRFFIDDAQTIAAGSKILSVFVWGLPFVGAQVTLMVSFQAFGMPIRSSVVTMGRQLLFYVPLLYLLNHLFGFDGFVWAQPAADILTTGIAGVLGLSLIKLMRGIVRTDCAKLGAS
ncbi:MAG: MATE family efflux transporter [Oscillospiraceae bacterium]|jgi:putative MATE family efflux protein|nr:MATE family efflux transporter [Oscillospiraceae bacterium]